MSATDLVLERVRREINREFPLSDPAPYTMRPHNEPGRVSRKARAERSAQRRRAATDRQRRDWAALVAAYRGGEISRAVFDARWKIAGGTVETLTPSRRKSSGVWKPGGVKHAVQPTGGYVDPGSVALGGVPLAAARSWDAVQTPTREAAPDKSGALSPYQRDTVETVALTAAGAICAPGTVVAVSITHDAGAALAAGHAAAVFVTGAAWVDAATIPATTGKKTNRRPGWYAPAGGVGVLRVCIRPGALLERSLALSGERAAGSLANALVKGGAVDRAHAVAVSLAGGSH